MQVHRAQQTGDNYHNHGQSNIFSGQAMLVNATEEAITQFVGLALVCPGAAACNCASYLTARMGLRSHATAKRESPAKLPSITATSTR